MVNDTSPPSDISFLGKDPEEICQFYFRQHWIRLWWPLVHLGMWSIFVVMAVWMAQSLPANGNMSMRHIAHIFIAVTWASAHLVFLTAIYRHFLYIIVVTSQRIHRIKRTLITHDDHQTVDLRMLQEIHKSQHGPIQNIFGFGSLTFEAQETVLKIHFIPGIAQKYERILRVKEMERTRERSASRG